MALAAGEKLGPYEILAAIGAGGMGEVYRARDTRLARDVALKTLPAELANDKIRRERFELEARAVAALNHPNIVGVHDIGSENGLLYIVTELVEGETLRSGYSLKKTIDVAAQLAEGLAAAHAAHVTHRDLKPDNVMLTRDSRVKILDFGLAKHVSPEVHPEDATRKALSAPGMVMGTVGYMSPEQVRGAEVDSRSDIFSFGLVLYQLLSGKRAFAYETSVETMNAILKEDPPELPQSVPPGLKSIVARCLEKEPSNRIQSAKDLSFALRDLSGVRATTSGAVPALHKKPRRPWLFAVTALLGVILGIGLSVALIDTSDAANDPVRISIFANDPAAEWSPTFSPDGRSVAYSRTTRSGSDMMVRVIGSDSSIKVTESDRQIRSIAWSADGTRLCYLQNRGVWCVSATGGSARLLLSNQPDPFRFTPDGKSLLFIRMVEKRPQLFESTPPGTEPKVVSGFSFPDSGPVALGAISADGSDILLMEPLRQREPVRRWISRYPSGSIRSLAATEAVFTSAWFPDRQHFLEVANVFAVEGRGSLQIADTAGTTRRLLYRSVDPILGGDLSPDGRRVVFNTGKVEWDIFEYSMDGRRLRPIANAPAFETYPSWNNSGDWIAYHTRGSLNLVRVDGSGARTLARNTRSAVPRFAPNGKQVAFLGNSGIETIAVSGGISVTVVKGDPTAFCWSSDSEWIFFGQERVVRKAPSQGGEPVDVIKDATLIDCGSDGTIAFEQARKVHLRSADGKTRSLPLDVAKQQLSADGRLLYSKNLSEIDVWDVASGTKLKTLTFDLAPYDGVFDFAVHPDGKRILLSTGGQRYDLYLLEGFARPVTGWRRWFRHWEP